MIDATRLKSGITFLLKQEPYVVVKYTHQKIGRGGASVKVSLRNLKTGELEQQTFNSSMKFEEISTQKRRIQYLYKDESIVYFMDPKTFNQIEIPVKVIEHQLQFIKEGKNVDVLFWEDSVLSVDIPPKVNLKVIETTSGVKGDTASNVYKPARLENGLTIKVPLFIEKEDVIRVDTRTSEYVERVK
jgi:elongation factor P